MLNTSFPKETIIYYGSITINSVPPNCIIRCVSQRDEEEKNNAEPAHLTILGNVGEDAEVYATGNIKAEVVLQNAILTTPLDIKVRAARTGTTLSANKIDINMVYSGATLNADVSTLMIEKGAIINNVIIPKELYTTDIKRIALNYDNKDEEKHHALKAAIAQPHKGSSHTYTALTTNDVATPRPRIKCDLLSALFRLIPVGRNEASAEASR